MNFKQLLIIGMIFSLLSCSSYHSEVITILDKIKQSPPSKIEPLPQLHDYVPVKYTGIGLHDPFDIMNMPEMDPANQISIRKKNHMPRPDFERAREYLESFPLETLTMVGTLERKDEIWALVIDKAGTLHKVRKGNYLGQNSGKIIQITEDEMQLEELIAGDNDDWVKRQIIIQIKQ